MTPLMINTKQVAHFRIGIDEKKQQHVSVQNKCQNGQPNQY